MSICCWVRAMDTYAAVYKMVEPKRLALAAAQVSAGLRSQHAGSNPTHTFDQPPSQGVCSACGRRPRYCGVADCQDFLASRLGARQAALDASNAVVAEKRASLLAIREKVAALQRQLADTQAEMASLTFQVRRGGCSGPPVSHPCGCCFEALQAWALV
jgi:glycyl-tRNA synthetase beta subunit